jgi:hypothetical protein
VAERKPFGMTTPCSNCPFRTDIRPYLMPERVREIEQSLVHVSFFCHKTTKHDADELDDGDVYTCKGGEMHCAGALILMEKEGRSSQMMRIAERFGLYDREKIDMKAPVFDTFDAMVKAQEARRTRRTKRRSR